MEAAHIGNDEHNYYITCECDVTFNGAKDFS